MRWKSPGTINHGTIVKKKVFKTKTNQMLKTWENAESEEGRRASSVRTSRGFLNKQRKKIEMAVRFFPCTEKILLNYLDLLHMSLTS